KRQSSRPFSASRRFQSPCCRACAQGAPNARASRTPFHGTGGCGSRHLESPTGGCAKGMPRNSAPPDGRGAPRSWPLATATTSASGELPAAFLPSLAPDDRTLARHEHSATSVMAAIGLLNAMVIPQASVGTSLTRNITTTPMSRNTMPTATPTRWLAKSQVSEPMTAGPTNEVAVPDIVYNPKNSLSIVREAIFAISERPVTMPPVMKKAIEHCVTRNTLSGRLGNNPPVAVATGSIDTKNTLFGVTEHRTTFATRQPPTKTIVLYFEPMRVSSQPANMPAMAATTLLMSPSMMSIVGVHLRMPAANTPVNSMRDRNPS